MTSSCFSFPLIFCFSRIFSFTIRDIYIFLLVSEVTLFMNLKNISFHHLTHTQFHHVICIISTKQIKFYENDESNDESYDSYASDDTSKSDFDFDYDELVDNFDEFESSDEDIEVYIEELNSMNEKYVMDGGFISISLKEPEPVSVFRTFSY